VPRRQRKKIMSRKIVRTIYVNEAEVFDAISDSLRETALLAIEEAKFSIRINDLRKTSLKAAYAVESRCFSLPKSLTSM
jgi:hypothetical protein